MNERMKITLRTLLVALLSAAVISISTIILDTNDVVHITVKKAEFEEEPEPYLGFIMPRENFCWSYSDDYFYAASDVIHFSTAIFQFSNMLITKEKRVAIIDVTDNELNNEIPDIRFFSDLRTNMDGTFYVKKGRKYKLAIYTISPDEDTDVSIIITGCNKIKTHYARKHNK